MHAHSGPQVVVRGGQRLHLGKFLHRGADAQRARDPGGGHGGANGGPIGRKLGESEVTVRIGEHAALMVLLGLWGVWPPCQTANPTAERRGRRERAEDAEEEKFEIGLVAPSTASAAAIKIIVINLTFLRPLRSLRVLCVRLSGCPAWVQNVWVGRSEPSAEPRISSILDLSCSDFSSLGKRMPTPCVRLPAARAGVIQATLPDTG